MIQYSTALSHIFLAVVGLYCFRAVTSLRLPFARISFGIIAVHSLLGIWRWGNPSYGYKVDRLYRITSKLQDLLVLPGIVTITWLKYDYSFQLACAHTLVSMVPLLLYVYNPKKSEPINALLAGNLLSLIVVSYLNDNLYGISTAVSYLFSYFFIKENVIFSLPTEVPTQDLFNYSMCFFAVFAVKSVLEPIY